MPSLIDRILQISQSDANDLSFLETPATQIGCDTPAGLTRAVREMLHAEPTQN